MSDMTILLYSVTVLHICLFSWSVLEFLYFSFDVRGKGLDQAKHWAAEQTLGGRAYFRHSETPAKLTVENVRDSDGGTYRCRVDFKKSPTRNSKVNLSIISEYTTLLI